MHSSLSTGSCLLGSIDWGGWVAGSALSKVTPGNRHPPVPTKSDWVQQVIKEAPAALFLICRMLHFLSMLSCEAKGGPGIPVILGKVSAGLFPRIFCLGEAQTGKAFTQLEP